MTLSRSLRTGALLAASIVLAACGAQNAPTLPAARPLLPVSRHERAAPASDDVAYQGDVEHTGDIDAVLRPPLREVWSVNLGGSRGSVGYPIVARGIVVVTSDGNLLGLDAKNGKTLWSQGSPSDNGWVGPAYDDGAVFADAFTDCGSGEQGLFAFDERTGKQLWSATPPDQCEFSSPPTAASGVVYTAAAADGGDVYAYRESNGALQWMASVENGDDSSPVVTSKGIYVSYACPQTYDFKPSSGKQIWHYSGPCEGGGGSTPVLYHGLLFVGDSEAFTGYNGLFFTAKDGKIAGGFNSYLTPAFAQQLGYFVTTYSSSVDTLEARRIPSMRLAWKAALNGDSYVTPPLVVGDIVYIATQQGNLFGYDAKSGKQKLDMSLGSGGYYRGSPLGLGYGSGELIVPNGAELIALKGS